MTNINDLSVTIDALTSEFESANSLSSEYEKLRLLIEELEEELEEFEKELEDSVGLKDKYNDLYEQVESTKDYLEDCKAEASSLILKLSKTIVLLNNQPAKVNNMLTETIFHLHNVDTLTDLTDLQLDRCLELLEAIGCDKKCVDCRQVKCTCYECK